MKSKKQSSNMTKFYWLNLHDKLQYLLDIHKAQGKKDEIFPFDLAYMLDNKWNSQEKESYKVICIKENFADDDEIDQMIKTNIDIIRKTRHQIHDKLQYLLDIHENKFDPFPLDLAYMLDLSINYMDKSFEFDKNYNYDHSFPSYYYTGKLYAVSFLIQKEKPIEQFEFFDLEEYSDIFADYEPYTSIRHLEIYNSLGHISDEAPSEYLLWKSAWFDNFYNYKRMHTKNYYDPENYLPEEEIVEPEEYYGIYEDEEPLYQTFNHFDQAYSVTNA
jgi:hypothetical protein